MACRRSEKDPQEQPGFLKGGGLVKRSVRLFLSVVTIPLLVVGCGRGELSRSEAKSQLEEKLKGQDLTSQIMLADSPDALRKLGCSFDGCPGMPRETLGGTFDGWNALIALDRKKFVSFQLLYQTPPRTWGGYALYKVLLTDAGRKYLVKEWAEGGKVRADVRVRELHNLEILGIAAPAEMAGRKVSVVNYRVEYGITPFGEALLPKEGRKGTSEEKRGQALFVLYDKGWQLEEM